MVQFVIVAIQKPALLLNMDKMLRPKSEETQNLIKLDP